MQGIFTYMLMKSHTPLQTDFWKVLVANLWSSINKAWMNQQQSFQNIYYTQILCYIIWDNSSCIYCLILGHVRLHIHSPMATLQWTELIHCCFQAVSVPTQQTSYTADDPRNFAVQYSLFISIKYDSWSKLLYPYLLSLHSGNLILPYKVCAHTTVHHRVNQAKHSLVWKYVLSSSASAQKPRLDDQFPISILQRI